MLYEQLGFYTQKRYDFGCKIIDAELANEDEFTKKRVKAVLKKSLTQGDFPVKMFFTMVVNSSHSDMRKVNPGLGNKIFDPSL